MITQKQFDELAEILFAIRHNCNGYIKTPPIERDDYAFVEQIRKLSHDIERWCDDCIYKKGV